MLKNSSQSGHSSEVRGWLIFDGTSYELAQVGPEFCIVREAIATFEAPAELVVEVDGDRKITRVQIKASTESPSRRIAFGRVQ